jgi:hypothetical protein
MVNPLLEIKIGHDVLIHNASVLRLWTSIPAFSELSLSKSCDEPEKKSVRSDTSDTTDTSDTSAFPPSCWT